MPRARTPESAGVWRVGWHVQRAVGRAGGLGACLARDDVLNPTLGEATQAREDGISKLESHANRDQAESRGVCCPFYYGEARFLARDAGGDERGRERGHNESRQGTSADQAMASAQREYGRRHGARMANAQKVASSTNRRIPPIWAETVAHSTVMISL